MYTELKNYQIIIAMLKKYGIRHLVLSAGSRNVPFVHSVESDPFFKCYSVVDERSAGYFAIGLAQELNEPVLISCTASTASCNYYPPVAEAFYQNVPLVILTSDRNPEMMGQREDQMINQVGMFDRHVRKSVNLPLINNKSNENYCERLLNEALLELNHNGTSGPVHINVPMDSYNRTFNVKVLPDVRKITRYSLSNKKEWEPLVEKLVTSKKILVICGQKNNVSEELNNRIKDFFERFNCAVIVDHMSNVNFDNGINSIVSMDDNYINIPMINKLMPDVVISFGGQVFSGLKGQLRKNYDKFEHWLITEDGMICDLFRGLKNIFECRPEEFFEYFISNSSEQHQNDMNYYNQLNNYNNSIKIPEIKYSSMYAIKNVVENIESNSILHLSINNSIRIANFFKINKNIKVYANIGTYGIDGCMSTFIGHSVASPEKKAFLIIGDLAFFYDMNSLRLNSIGDNAHILLINNHGGSEFYYNKTRVDELGDLHTTARHNTKAEGWVKENNFEYISASNKEEFDNNLNKFFNSKNSILFEVFTEMSTDAQNIHDFYDYSKPHDIKTDLSRKAKEIVKKSFGQERAKKFIDAIKK